MSAYLFLMGCIEWTGEGGAQIAPPSPNMQITATFKSMSLPNLAPKISDVKLYRENGTLIDKSKDVVKIGDKVKVECTVANTNANASSGSYEERYPMHLKRTDPTQGITSFADGTHQVVVTGPDPADPSKTATSSSNALPGADGVSLTLVGTRPTKVSYWATVSGTEGAAVVLSQALVEDSFQGVSDTFTTQLVDEHPLSPGTSTDPDAPNSGAGTAWHYTRLPLANDNGWNTTPVAVTFYGGAYDNFTVTPTGGDAPVSLTDRKAWTRSADTDGYSVSLQASTAAGAVSAVNTDKIKIDTSVPRIEKDAAMPLYTLSDVAADPSKATSGVWKLHRTNASGASLSNARATALPEFPLSGADKDKKGNAIEPVGKLPNGYYVVEDAAGNKSTPVKVADTDPPTATRPDPTDPDASAPAGPPYDPADDPVPPPTETEDGEGLRHAVIEETVTEVIDPAAPPFGGLLDAAQAKAMMDYRYVLASHAGNLTVTDELLDAAAHPITALDTTTSNECLIRRVVIDEQGNTTTINLHYRAIRPGEEPPTFTPVDPDGGGVNGDGNREPLPPVETTVDPVTGLTHAVVKDHVVVSTSDTPLTAASMAAFIAERYRIADALGNGATLGAVRLFDAEGNEASSIDRTRPGLWYAEQTATDHFGNTTTLRLTYEVREGDVTGGISNNGGNRGPDSGGVSVSEAGPVTSAGHQDDDGSRSRLATAIHQLPQTGGLFGPCPLHIMFVLIMVLSAAYTLMRLRQESQHREEARCETV